MIVEPLPEVDGARRIELQRHADERGWFARTFCERELGSAGLPTRWVQHSLSHNHARHTLRGMHWQVSPHEEAKLVRVVSGRIWDVIVDLRADSPTRLGHVGVELSAATGTALYVPPGVAHGFISLEPETTIAYMMTAFFAPESARGARWDDPAFGIEWPAEPAVVSERDANYPDWPEETT